MIYELRIYEPVPGRMPELLERFGTHTFDLFSRHDMKVVGFWEVLTGDAPRIVYILEFSDANHRQDCWDAFLADSDWRAVRELTEANGPILAKTSSTIMRTIPGYPGVN